MDSKSAHAISDWVVEGETEPQTVNANWDPVGTTPINGVVVKEIRPVPVGSGCLTEVWRQDWGLDPLTITQVFQRVLDPGCVSGWHAHAFTTDHLFCGAGRVRLSLYDGRRSSATCGASWQRVFGEHRPLLVTVPPGIWHGLSAMGTTPALVLNLVDQAFRYESPDHRRLPSDTSHIPIKLV